MKYQSTRGGSKNSSFEDVLFSGYAPDGGIFVPHSIPSLPSEILQNWKNTVPSYSEVIIEVVSLFVSESELPRDVLRQCIQKCHSEFDEGPVIPLSKCRVDQVSSDEYSVVELFHGKTKSFKDYSLSIVGRIMEHFIKKRNEHKIALVATSGDTGSASIEAVRGIPGIDIIVLYPVGRISEVQELQMITVPDDNVHVFACDGTNDELDLPIKKVFPGPGLVGMNSINWARVMIQVAHHIYLCASQNCQPVDIYVPTGGAGNISSGVIANILGFPVNLYCAQNVNDNVEKLVNQGLFHIGGEITPTYSNAMDIRNPYNVERLLYFLSGMNTQLIAEIMTNAEKDGSTGVNLPDTLQTKLREVVKGALSADTPMTLKTIKECWEANKYLICPHTATAAAFVHSKSKAGTLGTNKIFVIATASPEKFPEAAEAVGIDSTTDGNNVGRKFLEVLKARVKVEPKKMQKEEDWVQLLREEIDNIRNLRK